MIDKIRRKNVGAAWRKCVEELESAHAILCSLISENSDMLRAREIDRLTGARENLDIICQNLKETAKSHAAVVMSFRSAIAVIEGKDIK